MARLTHSLSALLAVSISLAISVIGTGIFANSAQAADVLRVAYAGSMGAVMDQFIGPVFAKANGVEYQGIGQGAYGLARQLEGRLLLADVFVPITPGPVEIVKKAGMIGRAVPVASTQMVIVYSPKSRFVPEFEAAAQGKPLVHHLRHLVVHGVLHLLGFDHEAAGEAERMEALEVAVLAAFGVPDPYSVTEASHG